MILRIVSSARRRCLPQRKQDIDDEPEDVICENWEPAAFDLYRRPSATISVFMGFDIATILLVGASSGYLLAWVARRSIGFGIAGLDIFERDVAPGMCGEGGVLWCWGGGASRCRWRPDSRGAEKAGDLTLAEG